MFLINKSKMPSCLSIIVIQNYDKYFSFLLFFDIKDPNENLFNSQDLEVLCGYDSNYGFSKIRTGVNPILSRYYFSSCINKKSSEIYIFGGFKDGKYFDDICKIYEIDRLVTHYKINKNVIWPCARCGSSMMEINEFIYLFGGKNNTTVLNDLWRFDTKNKNFEKINIDGLIPGFLTWKV
jgi:hypothetical protein